MPATLDATTLRQELYELRLHATRLQQEILVTTDPAALDEAGGHSPLDRA